MPSERLAILQQTFAQAMADPNLLDDAARLKLPISPIGDEDSARLTQRIVSAHPKSSAT